MRSGYSVRFHISLPFTIFHLPFPVDFRPTDEQELLRRTVREFAEAEIRPYVMEWDEAQHFPMDLLPKLASLGLMGIQFPEEFGGSAMSAVNYCICIEELARVCPAIALSVAAHNGLCTSHIAMFGSDAQKQRYLPRLVGGEVLGAWALTEAGAGSDAAGMRTVATRQGDCWVINGSKTFITHGKIGGVIVVMAITDPAKGHRGISAFVVEHGTAGMTAGKKENKLGMRASDTSEVIFQECRVSSAQLLGAEGQGFINTLQVLDAGRIGIAALSVGLAQGAYEAARRYALERHQFGQPIAAFQAIQWKLANNATRIEAARLLTYRAAYLKDQGKRTTREASMAKLFASETAVAVADDCVQIHGGYGFVKDYPAEKYFRDVKLLTIGEGTSEIQRLVIARQLLGQ
jgi:alkylation response protein AidB-like acyl-CoA dehydrogenase